jgi:hypothetical protein
MWFGGCKKMPDKKLTDNEIIKALNTALGMEHISIYCANSENEVRMIKVVDIVDLINRLQAEIKRLTEENDILNGVIDRIIKESEGKKV